MWIVVRSTGRSSAPSPSARGALRTGSHLGSTRGPLTWSSLGGLVHQGTNPADCTLKEKKNISMMLCFNTRSPMMRIVFGRKRSCMKNKTHTRGLLKAFYVVRILVVHEPKSSKKEQFLMFCLIVLSMHQWPSFKNLNDTFFILVHRWKWCSNIWKGTPHSSSVDSSSSIIHSELWRKMSKRCSFFLPHA